MSSLLSQPLAIPTAVGLNLSTITISTFLPPLPMIGLISSTSALIHAYCEEIFMGPLSDPAVPPVAVRTVWRKCFTPGFLLVASARLGSVVSGVAGYRASPSNSPAAALYIAALAFTCVHFAFLPWASAALEPILSKNPTVESDAKVNESNKQFFRIDRIRTFVSEVPAFVCFMGATISYLKA